MKIETGYVICTSYPLYIGSRWKGIIYKTVVEKERVTLLYKSEEVTIIRD